MTVSNPPVAVLVTLKPLPGKLDEVLEMTRGIFGEIRAEEEKCIFLSAHVDPDGRYVMLYELWADRETFEVFARQPHLTAHLADLDTKLESRSVNQWIRTRA